MENLLENQLEHQFAIMRFPVVMGDQLPADHGYALYSAISNHLPNIHNSEWSKQLSIELISGTPLKNGKILLPKQGGSVSLRLPASCCGEVLALAGKRLPIANDFIRLGIPNLQLIAPSPQLYSRIVIIKHSTEPEIFLKNAESQITKLKIKADLELPLDEQGRYRRRILRIHNKTIVGFSLLASNLSDEDSITLQACGLGGKRHMGCGIFNPVKSNM